MCGTWIFSVFKWHSLWKFTWCLLTTSSCNNCASLYHQETQFKVCFVAFQLAISISQIYILLHNMMSKFVWIDTTFSNDWYWILQKRWVPAFYEMDYKYIYAYTIQGQTSIRIWFKVPTAKGVLEHFIYCVILYNLSKIDLWPCKLTF